MLILMHQLRKVSSLINSIIYVSFCTHLHVCVLNAVCVCVGGGGILKIHVNEVIIEVYNILKGLCRRYIFFSCSDQFCTQFKPV